MGDQRRSIKKGWKRERRRYGGRCVNGNREENRSRKSGGVVGKER